MMGRGRLPEFLVALAAAVLGFCYAAYAEEPSVYIQWTVSWITVAPLGVNQQVIAVNGQFPGPALNVTTNWNVAVDIQNNLDEPLLFTWDGVQQRKNSWQDGVLGTNCPIPAGWNWTYQFQVKDQIGSFFYFPSINLQRAAGGYGEIIINNRDVIPIPFDKPDGDITLLIGDWFSRNHTDIRKDLDDGKELGMPDGILINGKGPYQYDNTIVPDGIEYDTINVDPGRTYRFRIHIVGTYTSLNFRIQSHKMLLVETEGSYTMQQNFTDLDIHVGQSYSVLVIMDQNASSDYYIVASARFVNETRLNGVAILHYSNSKANASGPLPDPPQDLYYKEYSMNQAKSIRWNLSASAARPNPQGSYKIGTINVTDAYFFKIVSPVVINGKRRAAINGISYVPPDTPLRLSDQYNLTGVYALDFPIRPMEEQPKLGSSVINGTYKGFVEIVFQNNDTILHTFHLDGHAFFVVGMDYGEWTEENRGSYNKWDAVARTTTQVFSGAWTAVLVPLDNVGFWNLRAENLDRWYLGQETYIKLVDPEFSPKTELPMPNNTLFCGSLAYLQKPQHPQNSNETSSSTVLESFPLSLVLLFPTVVTLLQTL